MLANNPRKRVSPMDGPPKGYRPHMPLKVKLEAALMAAGFRPREQNIEFHHAPPLQLRIWCPEKQDTIPAANDPAYIVPMLEEDHERQTNGRGGEKRVTTAGSDRHMIGKARSLSKAQAEFRRRILAKDSGEPVERKSKWPKRPFRPKRPEPRP